mmetsp:Transcript_22262/g.50971  ORF Transcript_22262/g.50971 Transcript_22262/m.50971 type:complete len:82 (+) Transcript_22262:91-336(+)
MQRPRHSWRRMNALRLAEKIELDLAHALSSVARLLHGPSAGEQASCCRCMPTSNPPSEVCLCVAAARPGRRKQLSRDGKAC